jgi:hypothetical protein
MPMPMKLEVPGGGGAQRGAMSRRPPRLPGRPPGEVSPAPVGGGRFSDSPPLEFPGGGFSPPAQGALPGYASPVSSASGASPGVFSAQPVEVQPIGPGPLGVQPAGGPQRGLGRPPVSFGRPLPGLGRGRMPGPGRGRYPWEPDGGRYPAPPGYGLPGGPRLQLR